MQKKISDFKICLGRPTNEDYIKAKNIFNKGRHPAFIGHDMVTHNARNGDLLFFFIENNIAAVSLVNPKRNILLALNVHPDFRG